MSVGDLFEGVLKGTVDYEVLDKRCRPWVYKQLYACTRSAQEAQDRTQNVFIKVHDKLDRYDRRLGSPFSWLLGFVRNEVRAWRRGSGPVMVSFEEFDEGDEPSVPGPEERPDWQAAWNRITAPGRDLPACELTALYKRGFEGKPFAQVAKEMGVCVRTAKSYVRHATDVLRSRR